MKIKRYFAPDMRQAIRRVREEQGPDAVILSNRKVAGGVEIISAIDYDESALEEALGRQATPGAGDGNGPAPPTQPAHSYDDGRDREYTPESLGEAAGPYGGTRPAGQGAAGEPRPTPGRDKGGPNIYWSQDPALVAMQEELKMLRGMLEHQLAHLAWNDLERRRPRQAHLLRHLSALGLQRELCQQLAQAAEPAEDDRHAWRKALALLAHQLPVTDDDILSQGGIVAVVGPTGVGKTTTVAKLAARYALRHGQRSVALLTTDSYRIGAHEQLLTYGRILGVPVQVAGDGDELEAALRSLADKQLVLIDTAGVSQRDVRLSERLSALAGTSRVIRTYLAMSATTHASVLEESVRAFRTAPLHGCILTKIDEAASLGSALSVIVRQGLPLAYVGDGQRVPEDLHPARASNLVTRAVSLMQASDDADGAQALAERFGGMAANAHG